MALCLPIICVSGAALAASAAALIFLSRSGWKRETRSEVHALMKDVERDGSARSSASMDKSSLPPPLDRHMRKVLKVSPDDDTVRTIKTLHVDQTGTFLLNGKWIPFTAVQDFSALNTNPGFVWDARMAMALPLNRLSSSINVRDSYVSGKGTMKGKLLGLITIVNSHDTALLNEGEISRWLAESVLFPTALLPTPDERAKGTCCSLKWKKSHLYEESAATAELTDKRSGVKTEIDFRFGKDGLISSIYALRPYEVDKNKVEMLPWEGYFYDYQDRDGMLVPTSMEVGWWKEGKLEIYFKGVNTKFKFTYV